MRTVSQVRGTEEEESSLSRRKHRAGGGPGTGLGEFCDVTRFHERESGHQAFRGSRAFKIRIKHVF